MMRELSLFTGAGGGLLGTLLLGWTPIGYVEHDDYCQRVIAQRIADGILPAAPIFGDVCEFVQSGAAAEYRGFADVVTGGFPCQPFSVAGKQLGADDPRNMWPATIATIREVRPRFAFLENVPGLVTSGYFGTILGDLVESGYDVRWRILSAAEMGAPHKRDRVWICAYAQGERTRQLPVRQRRPQQASSDADGICTTVSDTAHEGAKWGARRETADSGVAGYRSADRDRGDRDGGGFDVAYASDGRCGRGRDLYACDDQERHGSPPQQGREDQSGWLAQAGEDVAHAYGQGHVQPRPDRGTSELTITESCRHRGEWWAVEPAVGRVVDGYANRVAELRAAGNAQVASVVAAAWHLLTDDLIDDGTDVSELRAFWPELPDLDGVDMFSQYPIAGEPTESNHERETASSTSDGNGNGPGEPPAPSL